MKRSFLLILLLLFAVCGFLAVSDNTRGAEIELEGSEIYTEAELRAAANVVLRRFRHFPARLERLWYDEERCIKEREYFSAQYDAEDVLVLMSDFTANKGKTTHNSGFEPGRQYTNWTWVLVRNDGGAWQLKTYGY